MRRLKIGNAQAFWGDSSEAPRRLLMQVPDLDYLTLDYLSELSLSVMAVQQSKNPDAGYARDFLDVLRSLVPFWKEGSKVKIVANAGGLNPKKCAEECVKILKEMGIYHLRLAVVYGDNVLDELRRDSKNHLFNHLDRGTSLNEIESTLHTAHAYLGARQISEAFQQGADVVITGRVADPSLTVGPCIAHFHWKWDDFDRLAQATVAGHLIECGTQVTGGMSTHWMELPDPYNLGFPFIEMEESGNFILTKPPNTGGRVDERTVKEQLLYEIGNPAEYLSPDVIVSFLTLNMQLKEENQMYISGASGRAPRDTYKVSASYFDGYKAEGFLAIYGSDAIPKAKACGEVIIRKVAEAGYLLEKILIECIGGGDIVPGTLSQSLNTHSTECMLRICVADPRKEAVEFFTKAIAPLVTSGPQGVTGYASGRPKIRPVYGFWPCLISMSKVHPKVEYFEVHR